MSAESLNEMDPGAFLRLANQCGLELRELDLAQLARRRVVEPQKGEEGESYYTELHLYVVARYFDAVRPVGHPWSTKAAELTLDEVIALGKQTEAILGGALEAGAGQQYMLELERYLARRDPFGPLSEAFDFLQARVREGVRNDGRLYLELRRAASILAAGLVDEERGRAPRTRQMFDLDGFEAEEEKGEGEEDLRSTQVIDDEAPIGSKESRDAIEGVLSAVAEVPEPRKVDLSEAIEEVIEEREAEDRIDTAVIAFDEASMGMSVEEVDADEDSLSTAVLKEKPEIPEIPEISSSDLGESESSEPIVLLEAEIREEELQEEPSEEGPSPTERIEELNRLRQSYLQGQKWEELVKLYENGLELFTDPLELQQVYLVLGTLYEVKLENRERAQEVFQSAWDSAPGEGRKKAEAALRRLGESEGEGEE